jgi:uncharacterized circularly permuted ATP-grasp superfamily protein
MGRDVRAIGLTRPSYEAIYSTLQPLSSTDLRVRADALTRAFVDQGVTFALKGVARPSRSTWCRG